MISNANPWDNLKFDIDGVVEVQRRFFGTLQNTYSFFALYANLDGYKGEEAEASTCTESDNWITSRLNTLIKKVDEAYDEYEPTRACRLISSFVIDDLSNWYVRLNRKRFWKGDLNEGKKAAYYTLFNCLRTIAQLGAPIAPFYLDRLFLDLHSPGKTLNEEADSVHLTDFPIPVESSIDLELEERMQLAQTISSLVHSLRKKHKIKVRQPLTKILVPIMDSSQKDRIEKVSDLICSEINTKEIEFVHDTSTILVKRIKPNFRKLGKQYGPRMKEISGAINQFSADDITRIEKEGEYELSLNGNPITLTREDVDITFDDIPGWTVASDKNITVALDITITDELREEGLARDVVNRVQNLRKDQGLDVQDKILIDIRNSQDLLISAIEGYKEYICQETQALELRILPELEDALEMDIDEYKLNLRIQVSEIQ
jgi:isoleucyl-tRNA synthetase